MTIFARIILIACLLLPVSACRAEEGFDNILYEVKSYQWWSIIAFLDSPNIPKERSFHKYSVVRNAGYNDSYASAPARNVNKLPNDPTTIEFTVTWYEILTEKLYSGTVRVDRRELKPDAIQTDFGILIFRIAGRGDLQAVTYETSYPPSKIPSAPIILDQVCAKEITLSNFTQRDELKRTLADPMTMEGSGKYSRIEEIPSRCT